MKVVALISGGKDSCYNMMQCVAEGHDIVALANLRPKEKDELDSYMFQTVGHHAIDLYAEAMGLPLYRRTLEGESIARDRDYQVTSNDEVEDLFELLKQVKNELNVEAVSVGAILSDYQRVRVENVCQRLGLQSLAFLWQRDQNELLKEMVECGVRAILIKVAALGLDPEKHLGKTLAEIHPHMMSMWRKYGLNICGEGGEYETFTLDCPLFKKRLVLDKSETIIHSNDAFAPVAYLNLTKLHMEEKPDRPETFAAMVDGLPMKHSNQLIAELLGEDCCDLDKNVCIRKGVNGHHTYTSIAGVMGIMRGGHSITQVTKAAMDKLAEVLGSGGLKPCDILSVHLYVKDLTHFDQINSVYKKTFGMNPPIRICVEAPLYPNVLLQLDCIATVAPERAPHNVTTLHVQGRSHWAPANIGPYSQAKACGNVVYIAGQIALCPGSMTIVEGGVTLQARLSLRHVARILTAVSPHSELKDIISGVCYVTKAAFAGPAKRELELARGKDQADAPGLFEYVVVPALPRQALIEWQVKAARDCTVLWSEINSTSRADNCLATMRGYYAQVESTTLMTFIIRIEHQDGSASIDLEKLVLELGMISLNKILAQANRSTRDILTTVRLFFRVDVLDTVKLHQAYKDISDQTSSPSISLVPVLGFESSSTILSMCH